MADISFGVATPSTLNSGSGLAGNGDLTVTLPTGWAAGQFAIMVLYRDEGTADTPSGWNLLTGSPFLGNFGPRLYVYYRVLQSGDTNPVITLADMGDAGLSSDAAIVTYNNVGGIEVIGEVGKGTDNVSTLPSINTVTDNAWAVAMCGRGDDDLHSSASFGGSTTGVTERTDARTQQGSDSCVVVWDKIITTAGATGNATVSQAGTDPWVGVIISLAPQSDAPVGGTVKVYTGAAFEEKPVKVYNGSTWEQKPIKTWNGSAWV